AAITGAYVALYQALEKLKAEGAFEALPLTDQVAAISCGIYKGTPVLDLDYDEDSNAEADANFILTGSGKIVEIQSTAEQGAFEEKDFIAMLGLARKGIQEVILLQNQALRIV